MPSTHFSLHVHVVFATKGREPWIPPSLRPLLHEYLGGVARGMDAVPEAVGGTADHVHLLLGLKTTHRVSDLMREIKSESSLWLHTTHRLAGFAWQEGYGAFSVGTRDRDKVRSYVLRQEDHHRKIGFLEEYQGFLKRCGVAWDPRDLP